jgi:hypothetical protein
MRYFGGGATPAACAPSVNRGTRTISTAAAPRVGLLPRARIRRIDCVVRATANKSSVFGFSDNHRLDAIIGASAREGPSLFAGVGRKAKLNPLLCPLARVVQPKATGLARQIANYMRTRVIPPDVNLDQVADHSQIEFLHARYLGRVTRGFQTSTWLACQRPLWRRWFFWSAVASWVAQPSRLCQLRLIW